MIKASSNTSRIITEPETQMYVTRPLSLFRRSPDALSDEPPEGAFTGVLVITDEDAEAEDSFCFGICKRRSVKRLPFPQDKVLSVVHSSDYRDSSVTKVWFIPVLDQPLSANRYYVIRARGKYKGEYIIECLGNHYRQACVCSRERDEGLCCFPSILRDKKPKPLDPANIYQTLKIHRHHGHTFYANSISPDSTPPLFLRKKGWEVHISRALYRPKVLKEALGLDSNLRTRLPNFDFPIAKKRSNNVIVGEWYCPFVFVKEIFRPRRQMKRSALYKMTLSQYWEQIYVCENVRGNNADTANESSSDANSVVVDVNVPKEANYLMGMEALRDDKPGNGGFYWFKVVSGLQGRGADNRRRVGLGLSFAVVEKMRRVMEEGGWVGGGERLVKVERVEEFSGGGGGWRRFGCYVLVERFGLRRLDGTLLLRCEFKYNRRLKCKWE